MGLTKEVEAQLSPSRFKEDTPVAMKALRDNAAILWDAPYEWTPGAVVQGVRNRIQQLKQLELRLQVVSTTKQNEPEKPIDDKTANEKNAAEHEKSKWPFPKTTNEYIRELAEEVWDDKAPAKYTPDEVLSSARQKLTELKTVVTTKHNPRQERDEKQESLEMAVAMDRITAALDAGFCGPEFSLCPILCALCILDENAIGRCTSTQ
jgi:hypothetical protein